MTLRKLRVAVKRERAHEDCIESKVSSCRPIRNIVKICDEKCQNEVSTCENCDKCRKCQFKKKVSVYAETAAPNLNILSDSVRESKTTTESLISRVKSKCKPVFYEMFDFRSNLPKCQNREILENLTFSNRCHRKTIACPVNLKLDSVRPE